MLRSTVRAGQGSFEGKWADYDVVFLHETDVVATIAKEAAKHTFVVRFSGGAPSGAKLERGNQNILNCGFDEVRDGIVRFLIALRDEKDPARTTSLVGSFRKSAANIPA